MARGTGREARGKEWDFSLWPIASHHLPGFQEQGWNIILEAADCDGQRKTQQSITERQIVADGLVDSKAGRRGSGATQGR